MLLTQCPLCEHVNSPNSRFCNACGTPLEAMLCPHCGAVNDMTAVVCNKCFGSLLEKKVQVHAEGRIGSEPPPEGLGNGATREGPRISLEPAIPSPDTDVRYGIERLMAPHLAVPPRSAASMPHVLPPEQAVADSEPRQPDPDNPYGLDEVTESELVLEPEAPTEVNEGADRRRTHSAVREEIFGRPQEPTFMAEPPGFLRRQRAGVVVGAVALSLAAAAAYLAQSDDSVEVRPARSAGPTAGEDAAGPGRVSAGSLSEQRATEAAKSAKREAVPAPSTETQPAMAAPTPAVTPAPALPAPAEPAPPPPVAATPAAAPPAARPPAEPGPRPAARPSRRTASESRRPENSGALEPIGAGQAVESRSVRSEPFPEPPPPPAPAPVAGPCTSTVAALGLCTLPPASRP